MVTTGYNFGISNRSARDTMYHTPADIVSTFDRIHNLELLIACHTFRNPCASVSASSVDRPCGFVIIFLVCVYLIAIPFCSVCFCCLCQWRVLVLMALGGVPCVTTSSQKLTQHVFLGILFLYHVGSLGWYIRFPQLVGIVISLSLHAL